MIVINLRRVTTAEEKRTCDGDNLPLICGDIISLYSWIEICIIKFPTELIKSLSSFYSSFNSWMLLFRLKVTDTWVKDRFGKTWNLSPFVERNIIFLAERRHLLVWSGSSNDIDGIIEGRVDTPKPTSSLEHVCHSLEFIWAKVIEIDRFRMSFWRVHTP